MKKIFFNIIILTVLFSAVSYTIQSKPVISGGQPEYVVPGGETVGIRLYTKGLLVIALSDKNSPAKAAGLCRGDVILSVNNIPLYTVQTLSDETASGHKLTLECKRGDSIFCIEIQPYQYNGTYKIGAWVRDSTAGLGTVTFYKDNSFAALGHAVTDFDTGELMPLADGTVSSTEIVGITQGKRGCPGELIGTFYDDELGKITKNEHNGLYGTLNSIPHKNPIQIGFRNDVCEGSAGILADIDGCGVKNYCINIERVSYYADEKSIVFEVTDDELLSNTGGIVQGMSGAPILQNGKLVGAVTHVFVNDPTHGYGIFAENMLEMLP